MDAIPKLKIFHNADKSKYSVEGFNAVNDWACMNDKTWARVGLEANYMQREDILEVLCCALLMEKYGQLYTSQPGTEGGEIENGI